MLKLLQYFKEVVPSNKQQNDNNLSTAKKSIENLYLNVHTRNILMETTVNINTFTVCKMSLKIRE